MLENLVEGRRSLSPVRLELCPLLRNLKTNEEYFVALLIAGVALVVPNMAWAFGIGICLDLFIRKMKIRI